MSDVEQSAIGVRQAILIAKKHIADLFSADHVRNIGLEEVCFDEVETAGISRLDFLVPRTSHRFRAQRAVSLSHLFSETSMRTYKIVRLSAVNGNVFKIEN